MHWLHLVAMLPAGVAAACAARRPAAGGRSVAAATGVLMVLAMADLAASPSQLRALAWAGALALSAIVAAAMGRDVDTDCRPLHLLHIACLLVMAALTAASAGSHGGGAVSAVTTSHPGHAGAGDPLALAGIAGAAVVVVAGIAVTAGWRPADTAGAAGQGRLARVEALAGSGAVALMALAVL